MNSCKDALRLANSSCESLEGKLEEIEQENSELKVMALKNRDTIEIKTKLIIELQHRLDNLQEEHTAFVLSMSLKSSKAEQSCSQEDSTDYCSQPTRNQSGMTLLNHDEVLREHHDLVDDLNVKLQNMTYQKSKLQQVLDKTSAENIKLAEMLDKSDTENIELHARIKSLEEELNRDPSEPPTPSSITNSLKHSSFLLDYNFSNRDEEAGEVGSLNEMTLFGELQKDYISLKGKYDAMMTDCKCGSSKRVEVANDKSPPAGSSTDSSLRDLFQEVYATLKRSTLVADRLIDRHKVTSVNNS